MTQKSQPWIFSSVFDLSFIIAPAILVTAIILIFGNQLEALKDMPLWLWFFLIVGVDVSHVYSTIFRTYLNSEELEKRQALYILTPLFSWIIGCLLYGFDALIFWRVLAYLAVFHFIRQQYGFMMIYARNEKEISKYCKLLDKTAIYMATIYPIIFWHCNSREFSWFIKGDFFSFDAPYFADLFGVIYLIILALYIAKEVIFYQRFKAINIPKNLLLLGTAFSWFFGIVFFNSDIIFSATNIISHGIAYSALIWAYSYNQARLKNPYIFPAIKKLFSYKNIPTYIAIILLLAFIEESLWDGFIWQENGAIFKISEFLPAVSSPQILSWLIPLLTLPQATHYVLDAFIWRLKSEKSWKEILFLNR